MRKWALSSYFASVCNGSKADTRVRQCGRETSVDAFRTFLHPLLYALSCRVQPRRIRFTPVPLKARHDGWTPARQRHFIDRLAATKSVARACREVGMSSVTAYALRRRPGAESFAAAWDEALAFVPDPNRRRSPRAVQRLARLAAHRSKASEVDETHGPPNPCARAEETSLVLEALLGRLRSSVPDDGNEHPPKC